MKYFKRQKFVNDLALTPEFDLDCHFLRYLDAHELAKGALVCLHVDEALVYPEFPSIPCYSPPAIW